MRARQVKAHFMCVMPKGLLCDWHIYGHCHHQRLPWWKKKRSWVPCLLGGSHPLFHDFWAHTKREDFLNWISIQICRIGCPRLWRITKNSLHNEGIYKWVNLVPIFFWYKLLPTTSGPWKFSKIRGLKVTYFHFPNKKIFQIENMT